MRRLTLLPCLLLGCAPAGRAPGEAPAAAPSAGAVASPANVTVMVAGAGFRVRSDEKRSEAILALPIDQVWRALPAVFDSLGLPATVRNPETRTLGTDGVRIRRRLGGAPLSRYFNCGSTQVDANADSYDVLLVLLLRAVPGQAGMTTLETTIDVRARPITFPQGYQACDSTGQLEARVAALVRAVATRP